MLRNARSLPTSVVEFAASASILSENCSNAVLLFQGTLSMQKCNCGVMRIEIEKTVGMLKEKTVLATNIV